jgi:hypothetical protein
LWLVRSGKPKFDFAAAPIAGAGGIFPALPVDERAQKTTRAGRDQIDLGFLEDSRKLPQPNNESHRYA